MKKSLLMLVSVMLTTVSALALPTKPVISSSQYTPWAAEATGYLYNVEAGLFLTNGNWWGTHACGADNGSKSQDNYTSYEDIFLGKAKVSGNRFVIQEEDPRTLADGVTVVDCFSLQNTKFGEGKHLFCGGNLDDLWVDGGSGDNFKQWYVETNEDNSFKLKFVDKGTFGFQKIAEDNHNAFLDAENNDYTTWALVSEDVFSSVIDQFNLYYVSQGLNNLVVSIEAMGIGKDLSDYKALLESDETTYDEYASAAQELAPFVSLGEAIAAAKALDADHDWSEFVTIFENKESTNEELNNAVTRINAFISLKKKLDESIAKYPTLDFSAPKAVYDNPASENAALTEAIADIDKIIIDGEIDNASIDNPVDITSQIPHVYDGYEEKSEVPVDWKRIFIGSGSTGSLRINTWSTEATEDGMVTPFIENWTAAGGILSDQKVYRDTVEVRPGAYKITVKGRLFNESQGATYLKGANVFANINRKSITKEGIEGPENAIDGAKYADFNGKLYYYKDDFEGYGVVGSDGKLIFGMYIKDANCNWLAHKNYQVYYLGDSFESLDYVRQNTNLLADAYDEEVVAQKSLVGEYNTAISSYSSATDAASIISAYAKIAELQDSVSNNIAAYKAYVERLDYIYNYMGNEGATLVGPDVDLLTDYIDGDEGPTDDYPNGQSHYILEQLTLNTPEIKAELDFLENLYATAIRNGMSDGTDLTNLIVNPGFEEAGGKGWSLDTHGGAATSSLTNWHGGSSNNYCAEAYEQNFDVYQVIENVPNGLYEVSVQAFYRTTSNQAAYDAYVADPTMEGDAKVLSYVYFNSFSNPVKSVMEIQYDENLADNCWPIPGSDPQKFTLDGMNSASAAFSLADEDMNFTQKVYGLVTDGTIRLGIRNLEGTKGGRWTLWDNFKLVYRAKNPNAIAAVLEDKLDEYSTYVDAQKDNDMINTAESTLATTAMDNAEAALDGGDTDLMWDALIEINDAYVHTQEHVALMTELKDNLDNLTNAVNEYAETASAEALQKANGILETVYDDLTNDEISALSANAKDAIAMLKIPDTHEASDDNPIDMTKTIVNADIEEGATVAWQYTKNGGNGPNIDAGIQGKSIEFWNGTAANLKFNIWQDIAALPAGTYELTADASNCLVGNSTNNPDAEGRAFLYAATFTEDSDTTFFSSDPVVLQEEQCTEKWNNYSVIFTVNEGEKVSVGFQTSGTMAAGWFVADNFTLKYFGTESAQEDSGNPMSVDGVEAAEGAQIVAIYTVSGAPIASLQKGLNIVKYADGSVKKIFVK